MKPFPSHCTSTGFNYCKFSKTLVAIAVFPLVIWICISLTSGIFIQVPLCIIAVVSVYGTAVWLDRIPLLTKKIYTPTGKKYE